MILYSQFRRCLQQAFTLLELLVAMAILSVLVLCITQILDGSIKTIKVSRQRIDVDNEVRRIFDRMSSDFEGMLNRPDADFFIRKAAGSDEIYFFSQAPARVVGGGVSEAVALVGYRVNPDHQLVRFSNALSWDDAPPKGPMFLTISAAVGVNKPTVDSNSTIENAYSSVLAEEEKFHVLGEGVFRMEIDFLLKPDTVAVQPAKFSTSPFRDASSGATFSNKGAGLSQVQAIVVSLVALDADNRAIAGNMLDLAGKFPDTVDDGKTPAAKWQEVVNDPPSLGIPAISATNVRVYQRVFPVANF